jgi:hypothetical protein
MSLLTDNALLSCEKKAEIVVSEILFNQTTSIVFTQKFESLIIHLPDPQQKNTLQIAYFFID